MGPAIPNTINMRMISKVFVDTNVYVALRDRKDSTHQKARSLLMRLSDKRIKMYTSSDVVGESLTVISKKMGKVEAVGFLTDVRKMASEIFVDEYLHKEARNYFLKTRSKNISFVDCSSAIVMKRNKIGVIFSFDRDFKKLGVKLLEDVV